MPTTISHLPLHRVCDAPGLSPDHRVRLRRIAETITRRTGTHAIYNSVRKFLAFYYGDNPASFCVLTLKAFTESGVESRLTDAEVDDAVRYIHLGHAPTAKKDAWMAEQEAAEKYEREQETERHLHTVRPGATDMFKFLDRKRRGVAKVIAA